VSAAPAFALSGPAFDSAAFTFTARGQSIIDGVASKAKVRVSAADRFVVLYLEGGLAVGDFDRWFALGPCLAFVRWFAHVPPLATNNGDVAG
jgi:hypothetical protein